jgi:cytochrome c5
MERKMIMNSKYMPLALLVLTTTHAIPQAAPSSASVVKKTTANTHASQQHENDGSRIFQQNCSRCHATPEGFSPRISGTVVRHMRVRASLSQHDEQELLRFFNP